MRLSLLAVGLCCAVLAGCATTSAVSSVKSERPGERVIQYGKLTLVERWSDLYVSHTTIVVDSERDKLLARSLLSAAFPEEMGVLASGGQTNYDGALNFSIGRSALDLSVRTIDEYVAGRKGKRLSPEEERAKRAEFKDLRGKNFGVVYRYIRTRKKTGD